MHFVKSHHSLTGASRQNIQNDRAVVGFDKVSIVKKIGAANRENLATAVAATSNHCSVRSHSRFQEWDPGGITRIEDHRRGDADVTGGRRAEKR